MSQPKPVIIIHIKVLNSHDQYKDSKVMKKVRSELAIRAKNPVVEELLVMLLNQANEDVHKFQETRKQRELYSGTLRATTFEGPEKVYVNGPDNFLRIYLNFDTRKPEKLLEWQ